MSHYDDLPAENTPVSAWTLDECSAYVALRDEMHGEQSAEAGMGAMSLGYGTDGAYEAANAVARPESDPDYVAARAFAPRSPTPRRPRPTMHPTTFRFRLPHGEQSPDKRRPTGRLFRAWTR
jgi:hypothetical protein